MDPDWPRMEAIRKRGLKVLDPREQIGGDFTVTAKDIYPSLKKMDRAVDVIILAVKTYILPRLVPDLLQLYNPETCIVSYQNGLDTEEAVAEAVGRAHVLRTVINYAGGVVRPNEVEVTFFNPPNYIGALDPRNEGHARDLAELLTKVGITTEFTPDIKVLEWKKTLLNASLAPVSALTGLTMKEAMDFPPLREVVQELLREGMAEGEKQGIQFPSSFLEDGMSYMDKGGYHKPSMMVDVEEGRDTEIEYMNGRISGYGELENSTPFNKVITALVKGLELRNAQGRRREE